MSEEKEHTQKNTKNQRKKKQTLKKLDRDERPTLTAQYKFPTNHTHTSAHA